MVHGPVDEGLEQAHPAAVDHQVVHPDVHPGHQPAHQFLGAAHGVGRLDQDAQAAAAADHVEGGVDLFRPPDHREQDLVGPQRDGQLDLGRRPVSPAVDPAQHPAGGRFANRRQLGRRVLVDLGVGTDLALALAPSLPVDDDAGGPGVNDRRA